LISFRGSHRAPPAEFFVFGIVRYNGSMEEKRLAKNIKKTKQSLAQGIEKNDLAMNLREARRAVIKKMFTYIAAGFGLVIGLAWNTAISALIQQLFPEGAGSIWAKFVYAIILTVIVGYALYYVEKAISKDEAV
jgi:FtsH-binding integral membrane protein